MIPVASCCVSSVFKANCFVLFLCMRPIVTLQGTSFLIKFLLGSTQLCPLSYVAISTRFLTVLLTVLDLLFLTPPERVLPFSLVFLMIAVSLIPGDIYIPLPQVTLGCTRMALSSLVSISLAVRMCGSPLSRRVKLFRVPSLTIVLSFCVSLYRMLFPRVPGCGN